MPKRKKPARPAQPSTSLPLADRWIVIVLCCALVLLTVVSYIPAYFAEFVNYDDQTYVFGNARVLSGLSIPNILWAFSDARSASNWHPLTWISHMLDVSLFGPRAEFHHAVNVGLHAANVVLLFLLLKRLTGTVLPSILVATMFAVHPLNVESVAWVAQRKTVLSTLFTILSIWSYARWTERSRMIDYAGCIGLYALSLMAKPTMVTLPLTLLLLDFWPLRRSPFQKELRSGWPSAVDLIRGWWHLLPDKIPLIVMAMATSLLTLYAQDNAIAQSSKYPFQERLANVVVSYVEYLRMMVWPVKLSVLYPLYGIDNHALKVAGCLMLLITVTAVCGWYGQRRRYLLVGWLWYLGTMIPMIGIVHIGAHAVADRYVYIPFWGLWIALAWMLYDSVKHSQNRWLTLSGLSIAGIIMAVGLGWMTFRRAEKWQDTVTLFSDAAANTERNWLAHRYLAEHYLVNEDYQRCEFHCRQSEQWDDEDGLFLTTHGRALHALGDTGRALPKLQRAIQLRPDLPMVHVNYGWVLLDTGRYFDAADQFAAASRLLTKVHPDAAWRTTLANWGVALAKSGRPQAGLEKFELALLREPDHPDLLRAAAEIELQMEQTTQAEQRIRKLLSANPQDVAAIELLARALAAAGKLPAAADTLQQLIRDIPTHFSARMQLVGILDQLDQGDAARSQLQEIIRQLSGNERPDAKRFLSGVYMRLAELDSKSDDATVVMHSYQRAIELWPDNVPANNNLAWLLSTHRDSAVRNPSRAIELVTQAQKLLDQPDAQLLSTLAAAYAASGQFDQAVATGQQALQLAEQAGNSQLQTSLGAQIRLYEQQQPYVEP
ncbi:MAG: tetratricopeptide repeat protein [Pirellulaceae bacterium]|nr:tetratricopeptide repeat protein [Pirellulaceae bacterium]